LRGAGAELGRGLDIDRGDALHAYDALAEGVFNCATPRGKHALQAAKEKIRVLFIEIVEGK
jgi:hypothetical protein